MSRRITVAYGDGIGPEIMEAVLSILKEAKAEIIIESVEIGESAYKKEWNTGITPDTWSTIHRNKILLKSPTTTPQGKGHKSLNVALRKKLGLYVNIRPCVSYHPIIKTHHPKLDIVIIRENEEDTYTGIEHRLTGNTYQCAKVITKTASERICNYAFAYADQHNRKKVTCLIKDNIMKMTDGVFHESFRDAAKKYPHIKADHYIVDIGMAKVATVPEEFDVIVTENLYGDIISDITAQISGSVGLAGSANIGDGYAMFEAIHGSAPDIAGKNIANPSGLLNAAVQMLVYLKQFDVAKKIYDAWLKTLEGGIHTADIYNEKISYEKVGTKEFAQAVIDNLEETPKNLNSLSLNYTDHKEEVNCSRQLYRPDYKVKILVGVDVSISWDQSSPIIDKSSNDKTKFSHLVSKLQEKSTAKLELVLIHSKGMEVWPQNDSDEIISGDQLCCRFYIIKKGAIVNDKEINQLLVNLENAAIDVVKMEKLYFYDDKAGFSAG